MVAVLSLLFILVVIGVLIGLILIADNNSKKKKRNNKPKRPEYKVNHTSESLKRAKEIVEDGKKELENKENKDMMLKLDKALNDWENLLEGVFNLFLSLTIGESEENIVSKINNSGFNLKPINEYVNVDGKTQYNIHWHLAGDANLAIRTVFVDSKLYFKQQDGFYKKLNIEDKGVSAYETYTQISMGESYESVIEKMNSIADFGYFKIYHEGYLNNSIEKICSWYSFEENENEDEDRKIGFIFAFNDNKLTMKEQGGYGVFYEPEKPNIRLETLYKEIPMDESLEKVIEFFENTSCMIGYASRIEEMDIDTLTTFVQVFDFYCIEDEIAKKAKTFELTFNDGKLKKVDFLNL